MKASSSLGKKSAISVSKQKAPPFKKVTNKAQTGVIKRIKRQSRNTLRSILLSHLFQRSVKTLAIVFVAGSSLYGVYHLVGKTFANEVVISKSEIVARVSKLTALPEGDPYDVVRVEDETNLKKQNEFYKDVKEGDYIVMYKDIAIIYNLRSNSIVAIRKTEDGGTEKRLDQEDVMGTSTQVTP